MKDLSNKGARCSQAMAFMLLFGIALWGVGRRGA